MLNIIALLIVPLLIVIATAAIVYLHSWPEEIAIRRNHPYIDSVVAADWMGLLTLGLLMPLAFIWAFVPFRFDGKERSKGNRVSADQRRAMETRLVALESAVAAMNLQKRVD